ncbi:MAG: 2-C-methyl-D-erythritol 4-phosphate cytidylyltransferase [Rudaea sp.]
MAATDALWCVVPAAGRGTRVGADVPKQYLSIAGKPLLLHTLERLAAHARIRGIVVVLAADDALWPGIISLHGKPLVRADGGVERADSVLAGLVAIRERIENDDFVLVHDAARPCVGAADLTRLIDCGVAAGGGLLAAPLRDTLKRADTDCRSLATEPRDSRWRAQTPQLFRIGELIGALTSARDAGIVATDEAMAMERIGHRPLLVEGAESNIKVTTPADVALAEFLLSRT